ncbi:MAG: O-antigen ligase family protein [Oscillospiraceae bacterium]
MRLERIKLNFLRLDYLFGAAIVICQLFALPSLTSVFFYGTFLITLLVWICTSLEKVDTIDIFMLITVSLALIHVMINGLMTGASFSFQYMKKYIMFCSTMLFFSAAGKMEIDEKTETFLTNLSLLLGLLLVVMYWLRNGQMHLLNGQVTNYLTFRFTNPNLTALFLACMVIYLLRMGLLEKRRFRRVLCFLLAVGETIFVFQTRSRNSLLAVIFFFVVTLILVLRHGEQKRIKNWVLALTSVFPLIFVWVYLQIANSAGWIKRLSFLISEGKLLDSRLRIWRMALDTFRQSPVFGVYYQISGGTGTSQMHNSHLDIMVSYGIVVCALVCIFLYLLMCRMQANRQSDSIALLAVICALFLGIGEAALFSGGLGIYLFAGVFLLRRKDRDDLAPPILS